MPKVWGKKSISSQIQQKNRRARVTNLVIDSGLLLLRLLGLLRRHGDGFRWSRLGDSRRVKMCDAPVRQTADEMRRSNADAIHEGTNGGNIRERKQSRGGRKGSESRRQSRVIERLKVEASTNSRGVWRHNLCWPMTRRGSKYIQGLYTTSSE